jgi:hypothetical protein
MLLKREEIIVRRRDIGEHLPALAALMDDHPSFRAFVIEADRFHQSLTVRRTIARPLRIDMLGVQAEWAMVAVAPVLERLHLLVALFAEERLLAGDEDHEEETEEVEGTEETDEDTNDLRSFVRR